MRMFYGRVYFYFLHRYKGEKRKLAYIHNAANVKRASFELQTFQKFGVTEFIDVSTIKCCVGFFKIGLSYYVIEKPEETWMN